MGLYDRLRAYSRRDIYPFHMPGHKRNFTLKMDPYNIDITEIKGFDNLHHAKGILKEAQEEAAGLFGAEKCYYLVNGSTCGILASLCGTVSKGGKILMARNCHKSVYHGVFLRELKPVYLYAESTIAGIQGQISYAQIGKALEKNSEIQAVVITSPTYDGVVSDIEKIARLAHEYEVPLIVDQAHGAHFGFDGNFPESAVKLGADAVIVSLHKTLPSLTQTALLFVGGKLINKENVEKYLNIFETSSPSYVLMASMDRCIRKIADKGRLYFLNLNKNLDAFYERIRNMKRINVLTKESFTDCEAFDYDRSKIVIMTEGTGMPGTVFAEVLRERFGIEVEMACSSYVMALATIMDSKEGFERLAEALEIMDEDVILLAHDDIEVKKMDSSDGKDEEKRKTTEEKIKGFEINENGEKGRTEEFENRLEEKTRALEIHEADQREREYVSLSESEGRICGNYLVPYPPGIPEVVPGEVITNLTIRRLTDYLKKGIEIEGILPKARIEVVK